MYASDGYLLTRSCTQERCKRVLANSKWEVAYSRIYVKDRVFFFLSTAEEKLRAMAWTLYKWIFKHCAKCAQHIKGRFFKCVYGFFLVGCIALKFLCCARWHSNLFYTDLLHLYTAHLRKLSHQMYCCDLKKINFFWEGYTFVLHVKKLIKSKCSFTYKAFVLLERWKRWNLQWIPLNKIITAQPHITEKNILAQFTNNHIDI